jgi:hypothetical protein
MYQQMLQAQNAPLMQQMGAVDPVQAQQQQVAAYRPAQVQQPQQSGQMGMSVQGMQNAVMARKMKDASQVDQLNAEGGY